MLLPSCAGRRDSKLKQAPKHSTGSADMTKVSRFYDWLRRTLTWYVSSKIVLAVLVIAVSATSVVLTTRTYQAEVGGELNVTNRLVAVDKGFFHRWFQRQCRRGVLQ